MTYLWSVFTKPWSELAGDALARLVSGLGFAGAEVPVRDTAFLTPAMAQRRLPGFVAQLREHGVTTISVASGLDETIFAGCASAGVPLIRIMAEVGPDGYAASVRRVRERLEAAAPLAERYGVQVGVQPHHGRYVSSALGVRQLLDGLPREYFRPAWDAVGASIGGSVGGDWKPWFVPGAEGLANWSSAFEQLRRLGYTGPICLSGQYSDPGVAVADRLKVDLADARAAAARASGD